MKLQKHILHICIECLRNAKDRDSLAGALMFLFDDVGGMLVTRRPLDVLSFVDIV